jgi:hypothetical protein
MPTKNSTHHGLVILLLILAIDLVYVGTLFSIGVYAGPWERAFGDLAVFTGGLSLVCAFLISGLMVAAFVRMLTYYRTASQSN